MFWWLPAGLFASSLAVYKFGYGSHMQIAKNLESAEEYTSLQQLWYYLQTKGGAIYTVLKYV